MRLIYLCISLFGMLAHTYADQPKSDSTQKTNFDRSIRIHIGTTGPQLCYERVINSDRRLGLRLGGQYVAYRKRIRIKTAPESYIDLDPDFMIGIVQAGLTWHPIDRKAFFVVAGLGYTWHPNLNVRLTTNDKLTLGGLEMTAEDVGTIDLGFRWRPVVGYAGWGFKQPIPRNRVRVGFEMGVYYLGRPRVQLDYEGFLESTNIAEQIPVVERNLANYRYLPALNLTLSYTFGRNR